jgi:hypothetical protein
MLQKKHFLGSLKGTAPICPVITITMGNISTLPTATKQLRRTWDKLCNRVDRSSLAIMRTLHIEKQTLIIGAIVLVLMVLMLSCGGSSDSARPRTSREKPKNQGPTLAGIQERLSKPHRLPAEQSKPLKRNDPPLTDWQTNNEPQRADARNSARFGAMNPPPPPAAFQAETEQDRQRNQAQDTIAWRRQQWEQAAKSAGSTIQSSSGTGQSYVRRQPTYNTQPSYSAPRNYNTQPNYNTRLPSYGTGQNYNGRPPSYGNYNYTTSDYNNSRSSQGGTRY